MLRYRIFYLIGFIFLAVKSDEITAKYFKPDMLNASKKHDYKLLPGIPLTTEEFLQSENITDQDDILQENDLDNDDILEDFEIRPFSVQHYLWPKGVVPYLLDENYDEKGRILIAKAFKEIQNKTCVRFLPRVNQEDYIMIVHEKGCASSVGRIGGPQTVVLGRGCYSSGIMVHELLHTLGFIHEQSRQDRDKYVTVLWDNIMEGREENFRIYPWYRDEILKLKYDYYSILHYNRFAFSKDSKTKPTLVPKKDVNIGQRKRLSEGDILKVNRAYKCSNLLK